MAAKLQAHDKVSCSEFVENLTESGLFDSADVLPDSAQFAPNGVAAAQKLVEAGKLTDYQADAVLGKRFSELRIGNYEILDKLGAGGMGTVFKARHRRMKRIVALKVLAKELAESGTFAERFQREVETIAKLTHPNIVMAFDADEGETGPFLVMEFVNGADLKSEVDKNGPMCVADAVDRIIQSARGLEYAHSQQIVHRDIKPGNLLRDVDGVVKVADLGLARLNHEGSVAGNTSLTQAGCVVGTAEYMSPEQAMDSGQVDHRADIYSLGCTLYFLLTGNPLYQAPSIMSMLLKHRDAPIPDLAEARPDIPPELAIIFRQMVAKEPEKRYQSMGEVVKDLEKLQANLSPLTAYSRPAKKAETSQALAGTAEYDRIVTAGSPHDTGGFNLSIAQPPVKRVAVLVEPSRTQSGIIRHYLEQLGMEAVHAARSGKEALEMAKAENARVIVSSMHLPDMTGVQLARAVLTEPGCAKVGFVLATSESEAESAAELQGLPGVVLMPKPFDLARLGKAIVAAMA